MFAQDSLKSKTAFEVATVLFDVFCDIGFPRVLQSDNGLEFANHVLKELITAMVVDHRLITPCHPRANGVAERNVQCPPLNWL